jgi:Holliday junction resolvasome RuvABC ATP-dependent DNA helicase subunit
VDGVLSQRLKRHAHMLKSLVLLLLSHLSSFLHPMSDSLYLSEVFKIVEGASRLDAAKVRNYAGLLADKLAASGEETSARRLRKLLTSPGGELRPAIMDQRSSAIPVDSESRFPLLERIEPSAIASTFLFTADAESAVNEFTSAVKHRERLLDRGISPASTLLLYGPPGCGKSHLAAVIAARMELPLLVARLDGVISSYLGSTSKNLRAIFEYAAKTPCVLFLDEFDALAKLRDDSQELGELKRVVNSFIQTLDFFRKDLVLVAATNHEQLLDSAIWRRFSFVLKLDLPDETQRRALWRIYAGELNWADKEIDVLADLSEGYSCSAIKETSERLLQRWYTQQEARTMRAAVETLNRHRRSGTYAPSVRLEALGEAKTAFEALHTRNGRLYTQEVVSALLGVSRATLTRALKS